MTIQRSIVETLQSVKCAKNPLSRASQVVYNCAMQISLLSSSYPRFVHDHLGCFVRELASEIIKTGDIQIKVVTPEDAEARKTWNEKGIEVHRFRYFLPAEWQCLACGNGIPENLDQNWLAWFQIPFFLLSFLFHAWRAVRSSDIIWAHWLLPSGLVGSILKALLGKPLLVTVHSSDVHFLRHMILGRALLKFVIHQADRITVVCDFVGRELEKLLSGDDRELLHEKLEIVPMGVRPRDLGDEPIMGRLGAFSNPGELVVLYLGRLVKIKGIEVLIKAMSGLSGRVNRAIKLWIAGEGGEKDRLKALAAKREIKAAFLGNLGGDEKMAALKRADLVVIPSLIFENGRTEGLPVTLLEALSSGKAIIASEVGGIPGVIQSDWNGLLFPPGNILRLTECLAELIENPAKREYLARNAILTSLDFNLTRIGARFVDIFTNLYPGSLTRLGTVSSPVVG